MTNYDMQDTSLQQKLDMSNTPGDNMCLSLTNVQPAIYLSIYKMMYIVPFLINYKY